MQQGLKKSKAFTFSCSCSDATSSVAFVFANRWVPAEGPPGERAAEFVSQRIWLACCTPLKPWKSSDLAVSQAQGVGRCGLAPK